MFRDSEVLEKFCWFQKVHNYTACGF